MKAAVIVEGGDRHVRLTANHDDGVEVALLQFFHCDPLLDIDEVRLDPEPLENCQCSHKRAAIGQVDAHRRPPLSPTSWRPCSPSPCSWLLQCRPSASRSDYRWTWSVPRATRP